MMLMLGVIALIQVNLKEDENLHPDQSESDEADSRG
jgi:hypothetical protein